jgi:hypothetical protein
LTGSYSDSILWQHVVRAAVTLTKYKVFLQRCSISQSTSSELASDCLLPLLVVAFALFDCAFQAVARLLAHSIQQRDRDLTMVMSLIEQLGVERVMRALQPLFTTA